MNTLKDEFPTVTAKTVDDLPHDKLHSLAEAFVIEIIKGDEITREAKFKSLISTLENNDDDFSELTAELQDMLRVINKVARILPITEEDLHCLYNAPNNMHRQVITGKSPEWLEDNKELVHNAQDLWWDKKLQDMQGILAELFPKDVTGNIGAPSSGQQAVEPE